MYKLSELIIERTFANSFFASGIYEYTINVSRGRYNQSKLVFMLITPSSQSIERFDGNLCGYHHLELAIFNLNRIIYQQEKC